VNDRFLVEFLFMLCVFFSDSPPNPKMSSLDMFEESPVLEAGGGGSSSEAAGSPPEDSEVVDEAVGSVLTDRTNTIHIDQVRFCILYFWGGLLFFFGTIRYSTLLHLPPPIFHCADGCWVRIQDRCNWCIGSQTL
jgi:hypothetical protein